MESPTPEKMKCPTPETLSAVFDRECTEETILRHVRECDACRTHLKELEQLDRTLKLALEQETPADISERILAGIRTRQDARKRKFNFYSRLLMPARVAALFAVLGVVGYMIWNDMADSDSGAPVLPPRVAQSAGAGAELGVPDPVSPAFRKLGSIDAADLAAASFSNTPSAVYPPEGNLAENYVPIPDEVNQMWSVPARSVDFRQNLMSLIQSLGIPSKAVSFKEGEGQFAVRFRGTKMQTVRFVKTCKALGYSLLSPVQPQPEQNRFAGNADSVILYEADFVKR